jgi:hypothetical protein
MGLGKTGFGKTGFEKNGIRPSSRSGPPRQKLDHLCLCSEVAIPELQARVCMPRVDVPCSAVATPKLQARVCMPRVGVLDMF